MFRGGGMWCQFHPWRCWRVEKVIIPGRGDSLLQIVVMFWAGTCLLMARTSWIRRVPEPMFLNFLPMDLFLLLGFRYHCYNGIDIITFRIFLSIILIMSDYFVGLITKLQDKLWMDCEKNIVNYYFCKLTIPYLPMNLTYFVI